MLTMTPKSSVRKMRAIDNCFSASRGGIASLAESWQEAQRFWYTASPETAAEDGSAAINISSAAAWGRPFEAAAGLLPGAAPGGATIFASPDAPGWRDDA